MRRAQLQFIPRFDSRALLVVDVNRVLVRVVRPATGEKLHESVVNFPAAQDTLDLSVSVNIYGSSEQLELTLLLIDDPAADTVFRIGPTLVTATAGAGGSAPVPVPDPVYTGTGANATGVRFVTAPAAAFFAQTVNFVAEAFDANNVVIPNTPILFSSANPAIASVPDPATGAVVGGNVRGSTTITAELLRTTPTSAPPSVTAPLTVGPRAGAITVVSGAAQTGAPGAQLQQPIVLQVNGTDALPMVGLSVVPAVVTGGGSVLPASAITDANGRVAFAWTLGSSPGSQQISATVQGTTPPVTTTVSATASGGLGIVGDWRLDEATGQVASDASGRNNHGRLGVVAAPDGADPLWVAGRVGSALSFDGHDLVSIANEPGLEPASAVSVEVWARNNGAPGPFQYLVSKGAGPTTLNAANYGLYTGGSSGLAFYVTTNGGSGTSSPVAPPSIWDGNWHHLVGTFGAGFVRLYVDGVEVGTGTPGGALGYATPQRNLVIGASDSSQVVEGSFNWRGEIDEVRVLDRVLTPAEITARAARGSNPVATRLAFLSQPVSAAPNASLGFFQVAVQNAAGLTMSADNTSQVTLAIGSNPGGGTLAGTATATVVSGIASFSGLSINNPGTGYTLSATSGSLTAATSTPFSVTAAGGLTRTWTGATSGDWQLAANWSPAGIPAFGDNVIIPSGTPNAPHLTVDASMNNLTLASGATLDVVDFILIVAGDAANDGTVTASGGGSVAFVALPSQIRGVFPSVGVLYSVALSGPLTVNGDLSIIGAGATILVNGRQVDVSGELFLVSDAQLQMTNAADRLNVAGGVTFGGGDLSAAFLTSGIISVGGDFNQVSVTSTTSFVSTGTLVRFDGPNDHNITIQAPAQSTFRDIELAGTGELYLNTDVTATGQLIVADGGELAGGGALRHLQVSGLNASGLSVTGVQIRSVGGTLVLFDGVTFQGFNSADTALVIEHPGAAAPFAFDNLHWSNTPSGQGRYLHVVDTAPADGLTLTVNLPNSTPVNGDAFTSTVGGAVVNWAGPPLVTRTWTGAVSTDWSNAGNWSPAGVPLSTDDATIVPAALQPTLTDDVEVHNLIIAGAGARLTVGGNDLIVNNLTVHTDGLLVMTDPGGVVIVNGDAGFQGGNETGFLTAGELRLAGGFFAGNQTTPFSFVASGTHRTVMTGSAGLQSVNFQATGSSSGFQNLDLSSSSGINIQFAGGGVFVFDTLISQPGGGPIPLLYTLGTTMTTRRVRIDGMVMDRGTLVINENGVVATQQLDNVTFQNYLTTFTQLQVVLAGPSPRNVTFTNLTFQPLTTGNTGRYINVTAPSGSVVDLPGATPFANGPAFTTASAGVTVNWPVAGQTRTWTGATDTDWNDGSNWSPAGVPNSSDDVVIPTGTPTPDLSVDATINNLTIQSGASLLVNDVELVVTGTVDNLGTVTGSGGIVHLTGSDVGLRGAFEALHLSGGDVTLNGALTVDDITDITGNANLVVGGQTVTTGRVFVSGAAFLTMTNAADSVQVLQGATFGGEDATGHFSAGVLAVSGQFTQEIGGTARSFVSTGTRLRLNGPSSPSVVMQSSSPANSRLTDLIISSDAGTNPELGNLFLTGNLIINTPVPVNGVAGVGQVEVGRRILMVPGSSLFMTNITVHGDSMVLPDGPNQITASGEMRYKGGSLLPKIHGGVSVVQGGQVTTATGGPFSVGTLTVVGAGSRLTLTNDFQASNVGLNSGGELVMNGHAMHASTFSVNSGSFLTMTNPADSLDLDNFSASAGADGTGRYSAGVIHVVFNFTAIGVNSFPSTGTRLRLSNAASQTVRLDNTGPTQSRLASVIINKTGGTVTMSNNGGGNPDIYVTDSLVILSATNVTGNRVAISNAGLIRHAGGLYNAGWSGHIDRIFTTGGTFSPFSWNITGGNHIPVRAGGYPSLGIETGGAISLDGNITLGPFAVRGAGTQLILNGHTMTTSDNTGNSISNGAVLVMQNPSDVLSAWGLSFLGGDQSGLLTAGRIDVRGSFNQQNTTSDLSFVSTGTRVRFLTNGAVQNITMQSAGAIASHFHDIEFANTTPITLNSFIHASGQLISPAGAQTINGNGNLLQVAGFDVDGLTLNNVELVSVNGALTRFDNVTFDQYNPGGLPLTVSQPGGDVTFNNLTWVVQSAAGAFYISANDNVFDVDIFTITLANAVAPGGVGDGPSHTQLTNSAEVIWPGSEIRAGAAPVAGGAPPGGPRSP